MPRRKREWYPGAVYHITCRGNNRTPLFRNDLDFQSYLNFIEYTMEKYPFLLHGYCLMTNHVHLQIETADASISDIMQQINMRYARFYNRTYETSGHLFQGRFHSSTIKSWQYFLQVSRYIHRNPVEAEVTKSARSYLWSSFAAFLGKTTDNITTKDTILSSFKQPAVKHYARFVEGDTDTTDVYSTLVQIPDKLALPPAHRPIAEYTQRPTPAANTPNTIAPNTLHDSKR